LSTLFEEKVVAAPQKKHQQQLFFDFDSLDVEGAEFTTAL
jgi:hypothetical protein